MKTLAYYDRCDGRRTLQAYLVPGQSRWDRFFTAYRAIHGLGNIALVQIRGHKVRVIARRTF